MNKGNSKLYLIVHIVLLGFIMQCCAVKFVWSYDWSVVQDLVNTLLVIAIAICELFVIRRTGYFNNSMCRVADFLDIIACVCMVVLPFLLGCPTVDFIIWNVIVPIGIIIAAGLTRHKITG